jgi:hypothetical protein
MSNPTETKTKLTIEDLIEAQARNEKLLSLLVEATHSKTDRSGIGFFWFVFGGIAWALSSTNPLGTQAFSAFCLFVLTGLVLGRKYQTSAREEAAIQSKKQENQKSNDQMMWKLGKKFSSIKPKL